MAQRDDPYLGYGFLVDLGDGADGEVAGGFQQVSGIGTWIDQVLYRNGNDREAAPRVLPGLRHYPNLVLRRGVIGDLRLWQWIQEQPPARRTVTITLLDEQRNAVLRYRLLRAWPCKWEGPSLNGQASDVALETLELTYEGLSVEGA